MYEIAHRGYSNISKDNSRDAFEKAIKYNFDMIELDIQLSMDKKIFIYHDTIFDNIFLQNLTFDEIKCIEPSILSLADFYDLVKDSSIKVYLDLKGTNIELCHVLANFLEKRCITGWYVGSFNLKFLEELTETTSMQYLGLITENGFTKENIDFFQRKVRLSFISVHWTMLDSDLINLLHEWHMDVFTYTCKNHHIESIMKSYPVDGIVTNYHFH